MALYLYPLKKTGVKGNLGASQGFEGRSLERLLQHRGPTPGPGSSGALPGQAGGQHAKVVAWPMGCCIVWYWYGMVYNAAW